MSALLNSIRYLTGSTNSGAGNFDGRVPKRGSSDMRLKMSVESPAKSESSSDKMNSSSDFNQWLHAMKMVARLPGGMPPEFRKKLWLALAEKYLQTRDVEWSKEEAKCMCDQWREDDEELGIQIVKDLHRTGSSLFSGPAGSLNQGKLKRVLLGYARWNPEVGYCQGFNMLGAIILQVMDRCEVDSIKVMIYLIEGVLPPGYFCGSLSGLQADMAVFRDILATKLPKLARHLQRLQGPTGEASGSFEPPLTNVFTMQWFLTLFCTCLPISCVLRVWDLILIEGSDVLLRTALAIWSLLEDRIISTKTADDFYCKMGILSGELLNGHLIDSNGLIHRVVELGPIQELQKMRDKHLYNVGPWRDKKGLKLYYSDEEGESDDDSRLAVTTAWGVFGNRRGSASTIPNRPASDNKDKIALDISLLKKQYDRLRERQRQAHIILTAACARQTSSQQTTTVNPVNHLLVGRNALVTKGKRMGPLPGSIPPARKVMPATKQVKTQAVKQTKRGETLHWKDTDTAKKRKNSLKWRDIDKIEIPTTNKPSLDDDVMNTFDVKRSSSAASSISSHSEKSQSQASSSTPRKKSESSSYSEDEDEDANSSTSTSLCDDDIDQSISSVEPSPRRRRVTDIAVPEPSKLDEFVFARIDEEQILCSAEPESDPNICQSLSTKDEDVKDIVFSINTLDLLDVKEIDLIDVTTDGSKSGIQGSALKDETESVFNLNSQLLDCSQDLEGNNGIVPTITPTNEQEDSNSGDRYCFRKSLIDFDLDTLKYPPIVESSASSFVNVSSTNDISDRDDILVILDQLKDDRLVEETSKSCTKEIVSEIDVEASEESDKELRQQSPKTPIELKYDLFEKAIDLKDDNQSVSKNDTWQHSVTGQTPIKSPNDECHNHPENSLSPLSPTDAISFVVCPADDIISEQPQSTEVFELDHECIESSLDDRQLELSDPTVIDSLSPFIIVSTSQLSPIADISQYLSTSSISPLKTPSSYVHYSDLLASTSSSVSLEQKTTDYEVSDEGVTNEYFERVNAPERPNRLDLNSFIYEPYMPREEIPLKHEADAKTLTSDSVHGLNSSLDIIPADNNDDVSVVSDLVKARESIDVIKNDVGSIKFTNERANNLRQKSFSFDEPLKAKENFRPTSCPEVSGNESKSERVLKMIEENSIILHQILRKNSITIDHSSKDDTILEGITSKSPVSSRRSTPTHSERQFPDIDDILDKVKDSFNENTTILESKNDRIKFETAHSDDLKIEPKVLESLKENIFKLEADICKEFQTLEAEIQDIQTSSLSDERCQGSKPMETLFESDKLIESLDAIKKLTSSPEMKSAEQKSKRSSYIDLDDPAFVKESENVTATISSIKNTIKSIDSLCQDDTHLGFFKRETSVEFINRSYERTSDTEKSPVRIRPPTLIIGPFARESLEIDGASDMSENKIGNCDDLTASSRFSRDHRREPSPRRHRTENREEHASRLGRISPKESEKSVQNFSDLDSIISNYRTSASTKGTYDNYNKLLDNRDHKHGRHFFDSQLESRDRNTELNTCLTKLSPTFACKKSPDVQPIRHTTVTSTLYDRYLSHKAERITRIDKSPPSPTPNYSYLENLRLPSSDRSSKSAETSPLRSATTGPIITPTSSMPPFGGRIDQFTYNFSGSGSRMDQQVKSCDNIPKRVTSDSCYSPMPNKPMKPSDVSASVENKKKSDTLSPSK